MGFKTICLQSGKKYNQWSQLLTAFWERFPALYLSLFFLIGIAAVSMPISLAGCLLFATKKKYIGSLVMIVMGYFYFSWLYPTLTFEGEVTGEALVHIHHVKRHASPFTTSLVYEVTLKRFSAKDLTLRNLPCQLYLHKKKTPSSR